MGAYLDARSLLPFPTLAPPACPWHESCTPMDCENHRQLPANPYQLPEVVA